MTDGESKLILKSLKKYYPTAKIFGNERDLEDFRRALLGYDYEEIVAACKRHVRSKKGEFFPFLRELVSQLEPDEPENVRGARAVEPWALEADKRLDELVESTGGVCALLHEYGGMVGETIRRHYPHPDFCGDKCRKVAHYGECPYEYMTHKKEE